MRDQVKGVLVFKIDPLKHHSQISYFIDHLELGSNMGKNNRIHLSKSRGNKSVLHFLTDSRRVKTIEIGDPRLVYDKKHEVLEGDLTNYTLKINNNFEVTLDKILTFKNPRSKINLGHILIFCVAVALLAVVVYNLISKSGRAKLAA